MAGGLGRSAGQGGGVDAIGHSRSPRAASARAPHSPRSGGRQTDFHTAAAAKCNAAVGWPHLIKNEHDAGTVAPAPRGLWHDLHSPDASALACASKSLAAAHRAETCRHPSGRELHSTASPRVTVRPRGDTAASRHRAAERVAKTHCAERLQGAGCGATSAWGSGGSRAVKVWKSVASRRPTPPPSCSRRPRVRPVRISSSASSSSDDSRTSDSCLREQYH